MDRWEEDIVVPSGTRIEIQKSARFLLFGNLSIYCYWLLHFLFLYILFQWTSGGKRRQRYEFSLFWKSYTDFKSWNSIFSHRHYYYEKMCWLLKNQSVVQAKLQKSNIYKLRISLYCNTGKLIVLNGIYLFF